MDIDLLSKMVKELLLDNDNVVLPGLGSFVAEIVPSTFSDKGYTINPPYRKLYFRSKPDEGHALVEFYAISNKVDRAIADKVIREFVSELKQVLFTRKTVVFPGLGRLRATKENAVFFVADEDLDIYPEGFGLQSISLKTHVETPEQVTAVVEELKAMVDAPEIVNEPETAIEPNAVEMQVIEDEQIVVAEPLADNDPSTIDEATNESQLSVAQENPLIRRRRGFWRTFAMTLMWLVIVAVLVLGLFVMAAHFIPDFVDQILYTPEELEIINRRQ